MRSSDAISISGMRRTWRPPVACYRLLASLLAVSSLTTLVLLSRCGNITDWGGGESEPVAETSTLHIDLLERNNNRNLPPYYNTTATTYSRKDIPTQNGGVVQEIESIMTNLDKCLSAANLTEYFTRKNLLYRARHNAEYLLTTLRKLVPTSFSSRYNSPCWETNLNLSYCNISSRPPCPIPAIRGQLESLKYLHLNYILESDMVSALTGKYPQGLSSPLVCLPKVFLAGFPKCGSSYLFCLLERLVAGSGGGSLAKEPHFWVPRGPFKFNHQSPHRATSIVPYLLNFLPTIEAELKLEFSLPIDASPNLLFQWKLYRHNEGIVNYCLVPSVLPEILPHSKFIVVMRNPADMLYSAFWYSCSDLNVNLSHDRKLRMPHEFHEKVQKKIQIFENCTRFMPVDKCMENIFRKLNNSLDYCGRIRLEIGFYFLHIRKWLAVFPQEQFLFLRTEDFSRNITTTISEFLGISKELLGARKSSQRRSFFEGEFCHNVQTRYNYHQDPRLQMKSETRKILSDLYRPYNKALATLLRDDRYLWVD